MQNGLIETVSAHSVDDTLNRFQSLVEEEGFKVIARVDHAKAAASVALSLTECQLLIFGNPRGGTPLMRENIQAAIDLPLKALAYQNAQGQTVLAYNDPEYLASRHQLTRSDKPLAMMSAALRSLSQAACAADA